MVEWSVPNSLANWDALEILTGKISKTYHRVIQEFAKTTILMDETSVRGAVWCSFFARLVLSLAVVFQSGSLSLLFAVSWS